MENNNAFIKYAVASHKVELNAHSDVIRASGKPRSELQIEPGTLIKIVRSCENFKIVQVLDYLRHDFTCENLYECAENKLIEVSEDVWPYVISIEHSLRRLLFVSNKNQCRWIVNLKPNDLLSVKGEQFGKEGVYFDCIVRYIGPVQELHAVGYFFGLELLHLDNGKSPQSNHIEFSHKYMQCDPYLSIITTADWITPISNESNKKLTARERINETIEKVRTAIVTPNSNSYMNRTKKSKTPQANSKFYDYLPKGTDLPVGGAPLHGENSISPRYNQDHSKATINNNELGLEHKYAKANTFSVPQKISHNIDLLKTEKEQPLNSNKAARSDPLFKKDGENTVNKNATNNENIPIIADTRMPDTVDLADLLGTNWPKNAGDAAMILNRSHTNMESSKMEEELGEFDLVSASDRILPTVPNESTLTAPFTSTNHSNVCAPKTQDFIEVSGMKLTVGSLVEVSNLDYSSDLYGVIRWIGVPPGLTNVLVGVELEDDSDLKNVPVTDGSFNGFRLFQCHGERAIFVSPNKCSTDRRFIDADGVVPGSKGGINGDAGLFGHVDCPSIVGAVAPLSTHNFKELQDICGKFKGIQGHHNSCYLDATLFSMFTFTSVFDSLLYRCQNDMDISNYEQVQTVLREEIVNPLRKNGFVRADRVMKLRKLLDQLSSVSGLTTEEKDPEEFLNSLLAQIMRVEPFLKLWTRFVFLSAFCGKR
ncbi:ubiquitin carboxyl-terminal hydrolase CYLD isoform X2 [Scaptodrosophila lebanonensis]|uniref:ubiquitinyl hydrolase 1 n=1 Tax=Drosophila lebanonensis TaxID=7225 RepID=A0A6J2U6N2_DROLE|nr:ubiquitin carboxyl-terminal hydrolase CYLD isoform X2 [Scaptodrosophila lebanonensis]